MVVQHKNNFSQKNLETVLVNFRTTTANSHLGLSTFEPETVVCLAPEGPDIPGIKVNGNEFGNLETAHNKTEERKCLKQ